jgi:hypothetical protein
VVERVESHRIGADCATGKLRYGSKTTRIALMTSLKRYIINFAANVDIAMKQGCARGLFSRDRDVHQFVQDDIEIETLDQYPIGGDLKPGLGGPFSARKRRKIFS